MALIKCPECGSSISSNATSCPNCGCPSKFFNNDSSPNSNIAQSESSSSNDNISVNVISEETDKSVLSNFDVEKKPINQTHKNKKKSGKRKYFILIAILLILAIATMLIVYVISNGIKKNSDLHESVSGSESSVADDIELEENHSSDADVNYLSDRSVSFDEANNRYQVLFGLLDSNNNYISSVGIAKITIADQKGNQLYSKSISFSESDFCDWNNAFWDSSRYLCGLFINKDELKGGCTSQGVLTITVEGDTYGFDPENIDIFDLPCKDISISIPSVPIKLYDYDWDGNIEHSLSVEKIEIKTSSGFGTPTASIDFHVKLLSNNTKYESSYFEFGYKIYNSKNVVVDSGSVYVDPIEVGEICIASQTLYKVDASDSYRLTLENSQH